LTYFLNLSAIAVTVLAPAKRMGLRPIVSAWS
jgi:hypothetical protein